MKNIRLLLADNSNKYKIIEWLKVFRNDLLSLQSDENNIEMNKIKIDKVGGYDGTLTQSNFDFINLDNSIVLIDWITFSKNMIDIQNIMYENKSSIYICLLPHIKPFDESKTNQYPIDIQDAINNNFNVLYLDETPPKNSDFILVVNYEEYIITKDNLIKYTIAV